MEKQTELNQAAGASQSASSKLLGVEFELWYGGNVDPNFEPGTQLELCEEAWKAAEEACSEHARRLAQENFETWIERHPKAGKRFLEAMDTAADLLKQWFRINA